MTLLPSTLARDSSPGYKVDISRGQRIGRVSSEWLSRPDDERYLSLSDLYDAVRARAETATAHTVETRAIRVVAIGAAHCLPRARLMAARALVMWLSTVFTLIPLIRAISG